MDAEYRIEEITLAARRAARLIELADELDRHADWYSECASGDPEEANRLIDIAAELGRMAKKNLTDAAADFAY